MRDEKGRFCKAASDIFNQPCTCGVKGPHITCAAPRPFKVGGRVELRIAQMNVEAGTVGEVSAINASGAIEVLWLGRGGTWGIYQPGLFRLVAAATEPESPLTAAIRERDEARAELKDTQENLAAMTAKRNEVDIAFSRAISDNLSLSARAEAAEAKLADLKAALRMHALGLMDSPSFKSAIEHILES